MGGHQGPDGERGQEVAVEAEDGERGERGEGALSDADDIVVAEVQLLEGSADGLELVPFNK